MYSYTRDRGFKHRCTEVRQLAKHLCHLESGGSFFVAAKMEAEEAAMQANRTLNLEVCERAGVRPEFLRQWREGIRLPGAEHAPRFFMQDYPSVQLHFDRAAEEVERLTAAGKIYWYPADDVPDDVDVGPSTLIIKNSRMRLVHDWTRAGLNECLELPAMASDTLDLLINNLRPLCHVAGLDIRDCFLHWPLHASCRRKLGVRHPWTGKIGVYLFLPPGLGPAPAINDVHVAEVVRVAAQGMPLHIARYVDDLRMLNSVSMPPEDDKQLLSLQLACVKDKLERVGIEVHDKPGKLIQPTQEIEWLGWVISITRLVVELTPDKAGKGRELCSCLLRKSLQGQPTLAKEVMAVAGFLNFIATVITAGRPHVRSLLQAVGIAEVYAAWQRGNKRANPRVTLTAQAQQDLTWWLLVLASPPSRPLRMAAGRIFLWHQRNPNFDELRRLAWTAGLVVVMPLMRRATRAGALPARTSGCRVLGRAMRRLCPSIGKS